MKKAARIAFGVCLGIAALPVILVACLLIFGTAKPPEPLSSATSPFAAMDYGGPPAIERYQVRDGAALSYRTYRAGEEQAAVLIHGSAGRSSNMHALALALQRAGITVYVPDLRGHGANSPHGDIAYIGELDDDMADFIRHTKNQQPGAKWTLIGFSSGGGFALRIASSSIGRDFDNYILLSSFLRYDAPTVRPEPADARSHPQIF